MVVVPVRTLRSWDEIKHCFHKTSFSHKKQGHSSKDKVIILTDRCKLNNMMFISMNEKMDVRHYVDIL